MSKMFDVIIIGGGAAGLMCAIEAGKRGRKTLLVDHAHAVGEKIRISGGGRCNFTNLNAGPKNFLSQNPHFCVSALKRYTQQDFIKLVEKHNIAYHEKTLGQLFCDKSATQIIDMLLKECADAEVEVKTDFAVTNIEKVAEGFKINNALTCSSLIIATGGPSIPKMGSSGFGYKVAEQFGLKIIPPRAGLVPFTLNPEKLEQLKELPGVAVDVIAKCNGTEFKEAMLFTHRGLSGPAILQISSYWHEGDVVSINFLPEQDALALLKEKRQTQAKQELQTILSEFLPKKLASFITAETKLTGKIADMSNQDLELAASVISNWQIKPNGTEGYRTAEVTLGGVDTDELSSKTFESKSTPGLYFIGEVVDVTGWLGGYNFQWAWSSGHACGQYC